MEELEDKKLAKPMTGNGVKEKLIAKILGRLRQIDESKKVLEKDEAVLGIFVTSSLTVDHIVITTYRIFGVNFSKSHGNVVFANEVVGNNIELVSIQAKRGFLGQKFYYDLDIEKDGKKSKYTAVKSTDVDKIVGLLEKMSSDKALNSLIDGQSKILDEERINRDKAAAKRKQFASDKKIELKAKQRAQKNVEREKILANKQVRLNKAHVLRLSEAEAKKESRAEARQEQKRLKTKTAQSRGAKLGQVLVKYAGGYDPSLKNTIFDGYLRCYENEVQYVDRGISVPSDQIISFQITGKEQTNSRLTITRMVALGVFSLAVPKRSTKKEASIYIGLKDGRQLMFSTKSMSEFEIHKKLANAISHYSKLQAGSSSHSLAPETNPDQADLLLKYAELHKKGIITDDEFQTKKKQLLNL